jgi:hypothetical protein
MTHAGSSVMGGSITETRPVAGNVEAMKISADQHREHLADNQGVGGSNPSPRTKFRWAEELKCRTANDFGAATGVYVRRWYLETPFFTVRLHHWLHSDDTRHFHDHPWWFITMVLKGSYVDLSPEKNELMIPGRIRFRPANHRHSVKVGSGGAWTILLTGPKVRRWGFWVGKKWKKSNKYFLEHGAHICD